MLKISLDEGYIFDILSILEIKKSKSKNESYEKIINSFEELKKEVIQQIGEEKYYKIIHSTEYEELLEANFLTFQLINLIKQSDGIAKEIDDSNYCRYLKKIALQKTFFNNDIKEVKIGYENE